VYLWNYNDGSLVCKLEGHTDEVNGLDFHHEQHIMCTASDDQKVIVWDFKEGIMLRTLDKHTKAVYGCTFLGTEHQYLVATCCFDHKTRIYDMRDKKVVQQISGHTQDIVGMDYSSPRQLLATGSDDGTVCLWDTRTWRQQRQINTRERTGVPDQEVKRIAFSPDGELLATGTSTGSVLVSSLARPEARDAVLSGHTDCAFDVAWGTTFDNKKVLISASHDHTCRFWKEVL